MTTERDIRNQIRYAEKKGREEGRELHNLDNAKSLKRLGVAVETIAQALALPLDEVEAL